ncbi:TetR family transcriptional regulator [Gordonia sp. CPCC 205515]|uniref:TetR/AcrR family transcriptional regulator n=1 Tax=Gordonia sp. CPCC 205515 TaxID=3140791 RepID=UPI003AF3B309
MSVSVITYPRRVGRWPTGSRERLQLAALDLFIERGYESTSVADIAARAGVTERTFYRHFGDKREVLFDGGHALEHAMIDALDAAPPDLPPLAAVDTAIRAAATLFFADRLPWSRRRQTVIDANPELQERELLKMASLSDALAARLQARGSAAVDARLAAEAGVTVFKVSFTEWVASETTSELTDIIGDSFRRLRAVSGDHSD